MAMCGVDPATTYEQVEEALRIIGSCWTTEQFQWHGLLDIGPGQVLPRPVQAPHPPLFMACSKAETLRTAAEYGVGALVLGFAGAEEIAAMRGVYDAALAGRTGGKFVSGVQNDHFAALCPTIVDDDADEAFRIGARGQRFFAESILHWYGGGPDRPRTPRTTTTPPRCGRSGKQPSPGCTRPGFRFARVRPAPIT
jgi:alkanesulfonate monooxygenase SsuD/methylene tetrahydromethanopterin reductase-like flavin-dependent oxidoreductase (luciferase family)